MLLSLKNSIPSAQLPQVKKIDPIELAKICEEDIATIVKRLARCQASGSFENIEAILSLKECLNRLREWRECLSIAKSDADSSAETDWLNSASMMFRISKLQHQLATQIVNFGALIGGNIGMIDHRTHLTTASLFFYNLNNVL